MTLLLVPERLPHGCAVPGCPELVRGGARCPEHERAHRAAVDAARPSGSVRYPWDWSRPGGIREMHLRRRPECAWCGSNERLDVDHVDGDRTNHHPSNLRTLCHSCHSRRTARDQAFGRRTPRAGSTAR